VTLDEGRPEGLELLRRRAARVLVLDRAGRLLMMRGFDPAIPDERFWFTVGGGLDPGETPAAGAVRELHEETGLVLPESALVGPLHSDATAFAFDRWWIEQTNDFYAARVEAWIPAPAALEAVEVATVDAWEWWTLDQLRAQLQGRPHDGPGRPGEAVYPPDLPEVLESALTATDDALP
jgi:8-oxo-dGTP pyrophosphatase MutT (NUDIX family)